MCEGGAFTRVGYCVKRIARLGRIGRLGVNISRVEKMRMASHCPPRSHSEPQVGGPNAPNSFQDPPLTPFKLFRGVFVTEKGSSKGPFGASGGRKIVPKSFLEPPLTPLANYGDDCGGLRLSCSTRVDASIVWLLCFSALWRSWALFFK